MRGRLQLILGLLVSAVCLVLVFRGLRWAEFGRALGEANLWLIAVAAVLVVAGLLWRVLRWQLLFRPRRDLRIAMLFDALNIGYLASNVLPARVGEVIRPYALSEMGGPPFTVGFSTVMVERVVDMLAVVVLMLGMAPFLALPDWAVKACLTIGAVLVVLTVVVVVVTHREESWRRWLERVLGQVRLDPSTWGERLASLLRGFAVLGRPATGGQIVVWTLVVWLNTALSYFLILRAFGLDLSFAVAVFGLGAIALGVAAPSSPGQVGVFEGAGVLALALFTTEQERAVSAVLVLHALNYVILCALGFWSLGRRSLSYRVLLSRAAKTS